MAWNIGLLCIKADVVKVEEDTFLDIFYKSKDGVHFEEIASVTMDSALGVGYAQPWTLIFDINGRFIFDQKIPMEISKKYKIKTFWIAESLIYRDYHFGILKKGGVKTEVNGRDEGLKYLTSKGIKAADEWGETIIFQIIEKEIFNKFKENYDTSLWDLRYAKYELD
ncbi:hypothetical protein [Paenibacillus sp. UNC451MF]|uniref:hypothetical protein n=1 Tax=Paenibacillus sp. UNC451MF TaxID=1449063 RepID=UPI00048ADD08|nr:hypothetical protein [Paenibacillus sp. UNC451MF]